MTRAERLAAGWTEVWGLYDRTDGTWECEDPPLWQTKPTKRLRYEKDKAHLMAADCRIGVCARPFWVRKKPRTYLRDIARSTYYRTVGNYDTCWQAAADAVVAEYLRRYPR